MNSIKQIHLGPAFFHNRRHGLSEWRLSPVMKYHTIVLCEVNHNSHICCKYHIHGVCLSDEKSSLDTNHGTFSTMCMGHPYSPCGSSPPLTCVGSRGHTEVITTLPQTVRAHPISSDNWEASGAKSIPGECLKADASRAFKVTSQSQPSSPGFDRTAESACWEFAPKRPHVGPYQQFLSWDSRKIFSSSSFSDLFVLCRRASEFDFVEPLEDKYKCPICLEVLNQPYQTNCGHRFCYTCITKWIRDSGNECPNCKNFLSPSEIFPDNYAWREVQSLEIRCPNSRKGCKVVCSLKELNEHMATDCCSKNSIIARSVSRKHVQKHKPMKNHVQKNTEFVTWLDNFVDDFLKKSTPPTSPPASSKDSLRPNPGPETVSKGGMHPKQSSPVQTDHSPLPSCSDQFGVPWSLDDDLLAEAAQKRSERRNLPFQGFKSNCCDGFHSRDHSKAHETHRLERFYSEGRFRPTSTTTTASYQPLSISSEMSLISRCSSFQTTDGEAKMCF